MLNKIRKFFDVIKLRRENALLRMCIEECAETLAEYAWMDAPTPSSNMPTPNHATTTIYFIEHVLEKLDKEK